MGKHFFRKVAGEPNGDCKVRSDRGDCGRVEEHWLLKTGTTTTVDISTSGKRCTVDSQEERTRGVERGDGENKNEAARTNKIKEEKNSCRSSKKERVRSNKKGGEELDRETGKDTATKEEDEQVNLKPPPPPAGSSSGQFEVGEDFSAKSTNMLLTLEFTHK